MMDAETLIAEATRLGVETTFTDAFGVTHSAEMDTLARVVEALTADFAASPTPCDPVQVLDAGDLGRDPHHPRSYLIPIGTAVRDAVLTLFDGMPAGAVTPPVIQRVERSSDGHGVVLPGDLPIGCHSLEVETAQGACLITVVNPPSTMFPSADWVDGAALFVPTYALWEPETPLPSFGLLGRLARRLGEAGVQMVATLPLYAQFFEDPVDPSPYAPASRLHWNELLISEHLLDLPDVAASPLDLDRLTRGAGRYLDWSALAARRRRQLLAMADHLDADTRAAVHRFVHDRPDVGEFARFLAERANTAGALSPAERDRVVRSHELAQYLAASELRLIAESPGAALAVDLPVGCHRDGFERWANPGLFAEQMSIGAPPDRVFEGGQDWGLPPMSPAAMRRSGHRLWRDLLARAGEHAALVRIDHVMAVHRMWWIPEGMESHRGVYVRYPRTELMATIAATAAAVGTCVVGEDLGTVPAEVADAMEAWGMLGMYEEQFHLEDRPLAQIPRRSVAGIRTHDMTPLRSHAEQYPDLYASFQRQIAAESSEVIDALTDHLLESPAALVQIDLDDLCGVSEPHNLPGRVLDTLWSRRLDRPLSATLSDPQLWARLERMGRRRR